jgi:hypothetical protein
MTELNFPPLAEPYLSSLKEATSYILERFQPVLGIIVAGSILRGQGDERSDLDTFVIFEGDYRQRVQKLFNGVRFEIFANPPRRVPMYFLEEQSDGEPSTAHMVATGHILLNRSPVIDTLRQQAQEMLQSPPSYSASFLTMQRYATADAFENALDLRQRDPMMGLSLIASVLPAMLKFHYYKQGKFVPRHKAMLESLRVDAPELAALVEAFWQSAGDSRFEIASQIADMTIGTQGFFEWESEAQKVD